MRENHGMPAVLIRIIILSSVIKFPALYARGYVTHFRIEALLQHGRPLEAFSKSINLLMFLLLKHYSVD